MVTTTPTLPIKSKKHPPSAQIRKEKHKKAAIFLAGVGAALAAVTHASAHLDKQPLHTSMLTGQKWLEELMTGE